MIYEHSDTIIIASCVTGIVFALFEVLYIRRIKLVVPSSLTEALTNTELGESAQRQLNTMVEVSEFIARGAHAFLMKELQWLALISILACGGVFFALHNEIGYQVVIAFALGAIVSFFSGFLGMRIAVYSNVRTAHQAWHELEPAFNVAMRAGSVMGFALVSLGTFGLYGLFLWLTNSGATLKALECLAGYGLGGSFIALFARVGGGIYTKAADVGADLSGKNDCGIDEDDPRNPACIADNVGDNVGDIAGMGADLFGSLAESTCAAIILAFSQLDTNTVAFKDYRSALLFPITYTSVGILVGIVTVFLVRFLLPVKEIKHIERALKGILFISTLLMLIPTWLLPLMSFNDFTKTIGSTTGVSISVTCGLVAGLMIGLITEYYTSHSYSPVRNVARTQITSAATGIISGLALGYQSCVAPVILLALCIFISFQQCKFYGIALAAIGMLGTMTMGLTIDAYGPISDNAGGIAEMSNLGSQVRKRTDALDAAGNTTAAIGKGFAIGSAALVSLSLFGAYIKACEITAIDMLNAKVICGLLIGAMLPYIFSALTMKAVGDAAEEMVKECLRQFPDIMANKCEPDYEKCIAISTNSALREMVIPGLIVVLTPLFFGYFVSREACAGLLAGILVSGIQMGISASNTGGAWDNAKKYIEAGLLEGHRKGSDAHKNAVTGDTVGDPLKDTSGPSINILVKLSAIISVVMASSFTSWENSRAVKSSPPTSNN